MQTISQERDGLRGLPHPSPRLPADQRRFVALEELADYVNSGILSFFHDF